MSATQTCNTSAPSPKKPVRRLLDFLYIEPITACNLQCRMCYTNVVNGPNRRVLPARVVLDFVDCFMRQAPPQVEIYWCGTGEVTLHPNFPEMVNAVADRYGNRVTQTIQTNGTLPVHLPKLTRMDRIDFRVSVDGPRRLHDWHRGEGTFDRTLDFCKQVVAMGCRSLLVRTLLTRENIHCLDELRDALREHVGSDVRIQPLLPFDNQRLTRVRSQSLLINQHDIEDDKAIGRAEAMEIVNLEYAGRYSVEETPEAVDNYIALNPYSVMTCCHGIIEIGRPDDDMSVLLDRLIQSESACTACGLFPCQ